MAHENRKLHRRDVSAGVIDNNPHPADLAPEDLEISKSLDMMTKPVLNELDGGEVYAEERTLKFPTYSIHGKNGNFTADRDGTYRFVGCSISSLTIESVCTIILVNSSVRHITGDALQDESENTTGQAKIILVDSTLERVENFDNFYLSLHGRTTWNGGLFNCKEGNIRLLQSKDWVAENNIRNCRNLRFSIALTNGAKVVCVGNFLAQRSERLRFQWHHTALVMNLPSALVFDECHEVLTQHHNSNITAAVAIAKKCNRLALISHSSVVTFRDWMFDTVERPVLSATGCHIKTTTGTGGLLNAPTQSRIYLGNKTTVEAGYLIMDADSRLSMVNANVKTSVLLGNAKNARVNLKESELVCDAADPAFTLEDSHFESTSTAMKGEGICLDANDTVVSFDKGACQGNLGGLKLTDCSTTLKLLDIASDGADVLAQGGSLTVEGGSLAQSLQGNGCGHVRLSDVSIGGDISLGNVAAMEIYGTKTNGKLDATGGHFQSGGNTFDGTGNIDVGFGTLGGDTFGGVLTVKGIVLVGNVSASDVKNTGFMLLEGGSGSSHLTKTNRGWHVTESMDWVIDKNLWINVGENTDWVIGKNLTSDVGINMSYTIGQNASYDVGQNLSQEAGANVDTKAGANATVEAGANMTTKAGAVNTVEGGSMVVITAPTIAEN
ncbi:MAG: hypothetical protein GY833_12485 [Aestuariibacter sp.]|nr:hypothetical protein [Aestuariibacter sp.]